MCIFEDKKMSEKKSIVDFTKSEKKKRGLFTDILDFLAGPDCYNTELNLTSQQKYDFLRYVKYDDVDFISLNGYKTWAKCVKLYDGDTGTFVMFFNDKPYKFRVRLAGIDTAEKKSSDFNEVYVAQEARNYVYRRIFKQGDKGIIYLVCRENDKYGRVLADIYIDEASYCRGDKSINQELLDLNLAYKYDGKEPRKSFNFWYYGIVDNTKPTIEENVDDSEVLENKNREIKNNQDNFIMKKPSLWKRIFTRK